MTIFERVNALDSTVRPAVLGRLVSCVLLAIIYPWARGEATRPMDVTIAVTVYLVFTLILLWMLLRGGAQGRRRAIVASAIIDGTVYGFLSAELGMHEDPFYAWYVGQVLLVSVLLKPRESRLLTGFMALSYVSGHVLGHPPKDAALLLFVLVKTGALAMVHVVVAQTLVAHEARRVELLAHQDETLALNERLERSVAELRAVTEITELIHSTLEIEAVGPTLLDILEKVIDIPAGSLYVIDKAKQETIFFTSSYSPGAAARTYSGLELAGALPVGPTDGALTCIELVDHNQTVVVFCTDPEALERLTDDDRIVLTAVASELVVAVENSRLYRLTKRLAITDELTDLYNYRYLQQRLDEEIGRADRYNKRLSIIMLDVDDFKHVNDTHGHLVGDQVLSEMGTLLKSMVREVDVVARYGGEEFTIILPETDASGAFIVAEKIREAISLHRFPNIDGTRLIHLTASIGLASYPVHAADKESLLRAADDAVYHAKGTGKDRVRAPRLRLRRIQAQGGTSATVEEVAE